MIVVLNFRVGPAQVLPRTLDTFLDECYVANPLLTRVDTLITMYCRRFVRLGKLNVRMIR